MENLSRNEFLKLYSEAHDVGFSFCQKIRLGIKKGVELKRVKTFADWFYQNELLPHFKMEEQMIESVLGKSNELVVKTLAKHRRLKRLFTQPNELLKQLNFIEEELEGSIRFENMKIIAELEKYGGVLDEFIQKIKLESELKPHVTWKDEFWN